jgi:hypothetical protein
LACAKESNEQMNKKTNMYDKFFIIATNITNYFETLLLMFFL